jgi:hypothetical protein
MIDDLEEAEAVMERMRAALPMPARVSAHALRALRKHSPKMALSRRRDVTGVHYAGDEGGILCDLDFGVRDSKGVHIVSITHLAFDRASPLSR